MEGFINKNEKQVYFNQIKGVVHEIQEGDKFVNITLVVGHENSRFVTFVSKVTEFQKFKHLLVLDNKVNIRFYLTSRKKNDRWYTSASVLDVQKESF